MSDIDIWSIPSPADRVREALRRGVLLRYKWRDVAPDGRERACLLGWISGEVRQQERASACPADVMPMWLAELTPWLDDAPSDAAWPGVVAFFADLLERSGALFANPAACQRLDYRVRAIGVREARAHVAAESTSALRAINGVLALLDRAALGDVAPEGEWAKAEWAAAEAREAALAAANATPDAWSSEAMKAAEAAEAAKAAVLAAKAAQWAANAAVYTVTKAAGSAFAAVDAAAAAGAAADRAVEDRLVAAILDAWEQAIVEEGAR